MKLLIFTDSRGEHKASFPKKEIFTEKIKRVLELKGFIVHLITCPYKWTTTFDFIECCENKLLDIENYDKIILYTGIVEHSPRIQLDAINLIYNSKLNNQITLSKLLIPPNKKKNRIVNAKKNIMNKLFGEKNIKNYLNKSFNIKYKNNNTINLLSEDMLLKNIIPWLKNNLGDKLIFINSNRIVKGWEGNYLKVNKFGRPRNISIIEKYSEILNENLPNIINLLNWNDIQIKKYTVDNMHLTYEGSEWIYNQLLKILI